MPQIFGNETHWWLIYLVESVILVIVIAIFILVTYESPGFLALQGKDKLARQAITAYYACREEDADIFLALQGKDKLARQAITAYYACREEDADMFLDEIKENLKSNHANVGIIEIWRNPLYRRLMIPGLMLAFASTFSGITAIDAYTVNILQNSGMSLEGASLFFVGLMCVAFTTCTLSSFVVDRFGRRLLSLFTIFGLIFVNVFIFGFMYAYDKEK
uniref:Major facilitator superfamily (MFS) profile domain-containing protein n=1 Tax=Acrobeloides nanus TaxID=290746 RepID=A0A914D313_9BILA